MEERFMITHDWIEHHATPNGAWTRAQLASLGVSWPPKHGWKRRLDGTFCTQAQRKAFEAPPVYSPKTAQIRLARQVEELRAHVLEQLDNGVWLE